jgi:hypothetical protein
LSAWAKSIVPSNLHYYFQKQIQLLLMNKYIVFLSFLNKDYSDIVNYLGMCDYRRGMD